MRALRSLWAVSGSGRNASLDGLRGFAILLVIASHASAGRFPLGGMVGVTLFFVLSGYLITTLLLAEQRERGAVDLAAFYARRALRLLPALVVLLVVTPLLLWLLRDPHLSWRLAPASLVTLLYLSDFFRAAGDPLGVYGHTWSLAVEEQYYLVWPALLLLLVRRFRGPALLAVVGAVTALLVGWRLWLSFTAGYERAYFALDTNAFALLLGATVAVIAPRVGPRVTATVGVIAPVALLLLSTVPLRPSSTVYYVGITAGGALAGLLGVVALLGARRPSRLWSFRPLVAVGRLSYGLYLWHEVLLLATPGGRPLTGVARPLALVAAVVLALLSWTLVEHPILRRKARFERASSASVSEPAAAPVIEPPAPDVVRPSTSAEPPTLARPATAD